FTIDEPPGAPFGAAPIAPFPAISPDGRRIVFQSQPAQGSSRRLLLRTLDDATAHEIPGAQATAPLLPFWAADGRSIGFATDGKLKRYDLDGGAVRTLADAPGFEGATWNRDNVILFAPDGATGLSRITGDGGPAVPVTKLAAGQVSHRWPCFMPDGRHFVFVIQPGNRVAFGSLDDSDVKELFDADSKAVYA